MATNFSVSIDLSDLANIGPLVRAQIFNNLSAAVRQVAETGEERWKTAALKAPLWEGERQAYAASIKARMTGAYSGEIVSDYKYSEDIESGRPPYDLKRMLDSSLKVRVSKKGRRYLIIPMRHNTPGHTAHAPAMPADIYAQASELKATRITGGYRRQSGTGAFDVKTKRLATVAGRNYAWGGRLPAGLAPKLKEHHKADPYAGMVRMDNRTPGGKRYSSYLTFRVMAEGSAGWVLPARAGLWIARAVTDSLQRQAGDAFGAAIAQDLA